MQEPDDMVFVPSGELLMGSSDHYPEERPVHRRQVDAFWVDRHPVTVADFARFVEATGHLTTAERPPDPADFPDAHPDELVAASMVFTPPAHRVPLHDVRAWWSWIPGAQWRHPEGRGSAAEDTHPVTQVSYDDASAYAVWAGKSLPTEAEWEYAARGGLVGSTYSWGEEPTPGGQIMANTWHGVFPAENLLLDGFPRTSPVGSFPANGYGLHDVCGNVWEWTSDRWTPDHARGELAEAPASSCCSPAAGHGGVLDHVIKGGSHLCAPNYCLRYRPAARQSQTTDASTSHLGFRCVIRPELVDK